ncbi:MAG TPA: hypothetical protein VM686_05190, partial [Polyangiaceae bacterium]|nr:hypothetical protein [Polyangiaceae bacterium]
RGVPTLDEATAGSVGSEPSDIAISPSGKMLFVSNWGEGTVSMLTTADLNNEVETDLNVLLAGTEVLGQVPARPALAHPYALAISDDGDDDDTDETLYATEFFSQPLPGVPESADLSHVDKNRQGFVYTMRLTGHAEAAIPIAPVEATGFVDGLQRMTSCFPNQLSAAALDGGRLYVTAMCTSPRGPLGPKVGDVATPENFKTLFHPTVFVLDVTGDTPKLVDSQLLTQSLAANYDAGEHATNARMPLIPNDIAFQSDAGGASRAYVSALGASAVFRLNYDAGGALLGVGSENARYIDMQTVDGLPVGVATSRLSKPPFVLALNDAMQRLSIIDTGSEVVSVVKTAELTEHAKETLYSPENEGRRLFATGLDVWSYKGQAWGSCEACHPGGLSDGVTWYFARGPRRTLSAAGVYDKIGDFEQRKRRMMLWGANIDEVHDIEGIVRSVTGGAGGVLWQYAEQPSSDCRLLYDGSAPQGSGNPPCLNPKPTTHLNNGLNGSLAEIVNGMSCTFDTAVCDRSVSTDWNSIDAFIRALRPPRAPRGLKADDIEAGRKVFREGKCGGCHSGPHWSLSELFYTPGVAANGELPYVKPVIRPPLGSLFETSYSPPQDLLPLNPPAFATGSATLRRFVPVDPSDETVINYAYDPASWGNDQLQCALRDVGTFPAGGATTGIAVDDVPAPIEVRQDGATLAQGQNGFNIPPLFGLAVGAPYLHAGNARTLEELFNDRAFGKHHRALVSEFLQDVGSRQEQVRQLIVFLLSIDDSSELESAPAPSTDPFYYDFCR